MAEQGIHSEPHLGNLLPMRQADKDSGIDKRSNNPIVRHWSACLCEARARRYEMSEVRPDLGSTALKVHFPGTARREADAALEFGRFHALLRQRQLIADGVPVELGTRTFDLLLFLLYAGGALVTKDELVSRVWPGIVVSETNLKVQIAAQVSWRRLRLHPH